MTTPAAHGSGGVEPDNDDSITNDQIGLTYLMHVEIHDTVCVNRRRSLVVHRRLGPVEPGGLEFHDDANCS